MSSHVLDNNTVSHLQEVQQQGDRAWANRCTAAARLGIQILNHPGTALQATLPAAPFPLPQMGTHSSSKPGCQHLQLSIGLR